MNLYINTRTLFWKRTDSETSYFIMALYYNCLTMVNIDMRFPAAVQCVTAMMGSLFTVRESTMSVVWGILTSEIKTRTRLTSSHFLSHDTRVEYSIFFQLNITVDRFFVYASQFTFLLSLI